MGIRHCGAWAWGTVFSLLVMACGVAEARDYFLTIGGGYSPTGNQVSLEKNVQFFERLLFEQGLTGIPHDVYFSDGDSPQRDLQFHDPDFEVPKVNRLLAQIYGKEDGLAHQYRTHALQNVRGGSNRKNLTRWFQEVGSKLESGDRLLIYLTGHGGKGKPIKNPHFYMWNGERMPVKDFVSQLDELPQGVSVVTVMVQCYSGGFANMVFEEGDEENGLADASRCGFFATVKDRVAAGCTPDISEEDYHEYSTYFWAAVGGKTRIGEPIDKPDYDQDGEVSFLEAHAYALLTSPTIDISLKTSDVFLRTYSTLESEDNEALLSLETPYEDLMAVADPIETAVIEGLSSQLGLTDRNRAAATKKLAKSVEKEKKEIEGRKRKLLGQLSGIRKHIRDVLRDRWPEMENPWHPEVADFLALDAAAIVLAIESHPQYSRFVELKSNVQKLDDSRFDLERRWVKCQRLLRTLENVVLAANLTHVASPEILERYAGLQAAESASLKTAPTAGNEEPQETSPLVPVSTISVESEVEASPPETETDIDAEVPQQPSDEEPTNCRVLTEHLHR